jgi:hypothetical protein
MPAASASLARPQIDRPSLALLQPDAEPNARHRPKDVYDALMAIEVPLLGGGRATVKILPYRMAGNTPKDLTSGGDPDYEGLRKLILKKSRLIEWKKGGWSLTVDVPSARDAWGRCFLRPPAGALSGFATALAVPGARPSTRSQYFDDPDDSAEVYLHSETLHIHNHEMMRFFTGKARPREMARALFLAQVAGAVQPHEKALQDYCDAHSGMDCSGVAALVYGYVDKDMNATAYRDNGPERTRIEDFRSGDAIVWMKANHIAIIDSVGPGADTGKVTCWVVESTAAKLVRASNGVQYSQYVFERDDRHKTRKYKGWRPDVTGAANAIDADHIKVRANP